MNVVSDTAPDDGAANVISELRRRYDELTHSQKRIAEVIVEDPEFVAFATVDKLAVRLGVSPSTIVRFAYRLGLNGYPNLQERVRELVRHELSREHHGDMATRALERMGATVHGRSLVHDIENLERTISALDPTLLDRAVEQLIGARRLWVMGGATSHSVAQYATLALARIRGDVTLLTADERAIASLLDLASDDVLLVFTFPPYARRTLQVVEWATGQGATVVGVTDSAISPLAAQVDILLPAAPSGIGTQNSLSAVMSVANLLLNGVSDRSPTALGRHARSIRLVRDWELFLLEGDEGA